MRPSKELLLEKDAYGDVRAKRIVRDRYDQMAQLAASSTPRCSTRTHLPVPVPGYPSRWSD